MSSGSRDSQNIEDIPIRNITNSKSNEPKIVIQGDIYKYNSKVNLLNPKWVRYFKFYDDGLVKYFSDKVDF